jgi:hypothetical protein
MTVGSGLRGSFPLTIESIDKELKFIAPGAFGLGVLGHDGRFMMLYVGRSDSDVRKALKSFVGKANRFKFEYYDDPEQAFLKECELFHFMKPKANRTHPQRAEGMPWRCPTCGEY